MKDKGIHTSCWWANSLISLMAFGARFLKATPWILLCMWIVYSRVTTYKRTSLSDQPLSAAKLVIGTDQTYISDGWTSCCLLSSLWCHFLLSFHNYLSFLILENAQHNHQSSDLRRAWRLLLLLLLLPLLPTNTLILWLTLVYFWYFYLGRWWFISARRDEHFWRPLKQCS